MPAQAESWRVRISARPLGDDDSAGVEFQYLEIGGRHPGSVIYSQIFCASDFGIVFGLREACVIAVFGAILSRCGKAHFPFAENPWAFFPDGFQNLIFPEPHEIHFSPRGTRNPPRLRDAPQGRMRKTERGPQGQARPPEKSVFFMEVFRFSCGSIKGFSRVRQGESRMRYGSLRRAKRFHAFSPRRLRPFRTPSRACGFPQIRRWRTFFQPRRASGIPSWFLRGIRSPPACRRTLSQ